MKTGIHPEDIVVAFAARALNRPVRWQAERVEDFLKAVGEIGTTGAMPAVVNAVIHALDHGGQGRAAERVRRPLTPSGVWRALASDFDPSLFA